MKRAVCNELFGSISFEQSCDLLASNNFHGVEIAPFTLYDEKYRISKEDLSRVRNALSGSGLDFAGFHWLLSKPDGLHLTAVDPVKRKEAKERLLYLLDLSGELGGGNLILGSPKQRGSVDISSQRAVGYLRDELSDIAVHARQCRSKILLEALPKSSTDVVNTLEEVRTILKEIDDAGIDGMFDFHNCGDESLSWGELIREYSRIIKHVHLNTWEGGYPVRGQKDEFEDAFTALSEIQYEGWMSLEVFSVLEDPKELLKSTKGFLDAFV